MAECLKFTYDNDPANNVRDEVRFYCGDTLRERPLLDDREVDFAIAANPNPKLAASELCSHLAARFSREADITVGPVSKKLGDIAERFAKRAGELKADACSGARPSFPATDAAARQRIEAETAGGPQPQFRIGQFDNPWAVQFDDELVNSGWNGWR